MPYDGTGPAMEDLIGKQVDFMCDQTTNTTTHIKAGTIKAYAITSAERNDALPDLPTTAEAGLPDVQVRVWHGLYVPAETPDDVVLTLSAALQQALTTTTSSPSSPSWAPLRSRPIRPRPRRIAKSSSRRSSSGRRCSQAAGS